MSSEQDEQMIQEIVGQVMAASIEGNIEVELSTPDKSADSIEEVKVTIPIGTKTEGSGDSSMIQEQEHNMGLPEMNDVFITGQNGGIHSTDITISGVEEKIPPAEFNLSSIRSPDRLDALLDLSEVSQPTNEQSESANVTNTEEVMSPKHLERKLETDGDEEDKENVDTATNIESIVENFGSDVDKVFEPITPPVLGTTNAQEQHSLEQHEQQQQLFNVSAAIAVGSDTYVVNVPESGEESGDPSMNTDALKANGKEVGGAKIEVSTNGHQTKAEQKPKTKLCTII